MVSPANQQPRSRSVIVSMRHIHHQQRQLPSDSHTSFAQLPVLLHLGADVDSYCPQPVQAVKDVTPTSFAHHVGQTVG